MVRNAASMQSLRNSMADVSISNDAQMQDVNAAPNEPCLQKLDGTAPAIQICGNDAYTKSLMTKVAMGQATAEEQAAFNTHVNQARSLPSINSLVQKSSASSSTSTHTSPSIEAAQQPGSYGVQEYAQYSVTPGAQEKKRQLMARQNTEKEPAEAEKPKRQDYISQLMLLERQNKKRWADSRQELPPNQPHEQQARQDQAQVQVENRAAVDEYETQLALLEQSNKRRLLQARQEQDARAAEEQRRIRAQNQMRFSAKDAAHRDPAEQVRLFEKVNRSRLLKASQEQHIRQAQEQRRMSMAMQQPQASLSASEVDPNKRQSWVHNARLENMWQKQAEMQKNTPPKSKGLAATLAANDEARRFKQSTRANAAKYTKPFCDFLTDNPTVFHCVDAMKRQMLDAGWTQLSERETWDLEPSGSYFVERNGSSLIAFVVGAGYEPGNGAAILAGHVDALTAKLKPISQVPNKAGYLQLGVAPYAGGLGRTWWDRDLGIGGRVHIKEGNRIFTRLVKLDWPIAKIPSLAEHFGAVAAEPFANPNKETQMVPIIGLAGTESSTVGPYGVAEPFSQPPLLGGAYGPVGSFASTQPPALVGAITTALGLEPHGEAQIVNWELELFDVQPATVAGLNKEFISAGRIDDKLCSWAAFQAILESQVTDTKHSSLIKVVGLFDDEEIGSLLRQGARGNFLPITLERAVGSLAGGRPDSDLMGQTYANSFLVSSDVTHAVNPNFLGQYLENHAPHLNVGVAVAADSNGHMTTDSVSTTILRRCADKVGAQLQVFQIRNDSRSGGTVGPMLSSALGIRAIDAGLAQLSMHSIRATCGALDPGLGVLLFQGFLNGFEEVDKEMQE